MLIRIGYDISFEIANSTPLIAMLYVHPLRRDDLQSPEEMKVEPNLPVHTYLDAFGNICGRLLAPPGTIRFNLDTRIHDSGVPDPEAPEAIQHNVEDLPDETLRFLLPSRYCEVDKLNDEAWRLFGPTRPGWSRVQTICDWVHEHITFGYHFADPQKSALEVATAKACAAILCIWGLPFVAASTFRHVMSPVTLATSEFHLLLTRWISAHGSKFFSVINGTPSMHVIISDASVASLWRSAVMPLMSHLRPTSAALS